MNYRVFLFDFDYTLADSSKGIVKCFQNVLQRHGYDQVGDDQIKRTIGMTLENAFTKLTGITSPDTIEQYKQEYVKEADEHMTPNTVLFLETKSMLMALKDSGARIGIISTKYRYRIEEMMKKELPPNYIDIIIGGEDVKQYKPSPEGLLKAIRILDCDPAEVLYIGDSDIDAQTAQAAGVDFAGITYGTTTADELAQYPHVRIMQTLDELLNTDSWTSKPNRRKPWNTANIIMGVIMLSLIMALLYVTTLFFK